MLGDRLNIVLSKNWKKIIGFGLGEQNINLRGGRLPVIWEELTSLSFGIVHIVRCEKKKVLHNSDLYRVCWIKLCNVGQLQVAWYFSGLKLKHYITRYQLVYDYPRNYVFIFAYTPTLLSIPLKVFFQI